MRGTLHIGWLLRINATYKANVPLNIGSGRGNKQRELATTLDWNDKWLGTIMSLYYMAMTNCINRQFHNFR